MSTQWLPNVKRILSAARTYKRACGKVRSVERQSKYADEISIAEAISWGRKRRAAEVEKNYAAKCLLHYIDTGERYGRRPKP